MAFYSQTLTEAFASSDILIKGNRRILTEVFSLIDERPPSKYCLSFDGMDDYVEIGDVFGFEGRVPFSVGFWIFDTGYTGIWERIISKEKTSVPREGWGIVRSDTLNQYRFSRWQNGGQESININYTPNQWNFIVFTYDGDNMRAYLNGSLVDIVASTISIQTIPYPFRIGRVSDDTGYLRGTLDEVRIYNVARSSAWIKASYNSGNDSLLSYGSEESGAGIIPAVIIFE